MTFVCSCVGIDPRLGKAAPGDKSHREQRVASHERISREPSTWIGERRLRRIRGEFINPGLLRRLSVHIFPVGQTESMRDETPPLRGASDSPLSQASAVGSWTRRPSISTSERSPSARASSSRPRSSGCTASRRDEALALIAHLAGRAQSTDAGRDRRAGARLVVTCPRGCVARCGTAG